MTISGYTARALAMATGKQTVGNDLKDTLDTLEERFDPTLGTIVTSGTAGGTIPAYRLVIGNATGTLVVGTASSKRVIGANFQNASVASSGTVTLGVGYVNAVAAEPLIAGDLLKCGDNGRILTYVDADTVSETVSAGTVGNFGNQPANDGVEILSSETADTTQTVTIIGTTHGGHTVVTETKTLTGTTAVSTTKTDWGLVLAVKLSAAATGTVTVREASGNATITTITAGDTTAGVKEVGAAAQGAHGLIPYIKAGGASTKEVGVLYEPATGAADAYMAAALNGTNAVALPAAANLVKEIYAGDVATGTVATVYTNATEDDEVCCIGKAVENIEAGETGTIYLRP